MKIKLLANPKKAWAKALAKEVSRFLSHSGHDIVKKGAQITLCIGGDGTILYANHLNRIEGSILAIGSGKSYICQLNADNWKEKILDLIKNNKTIPLSVLNLILISDSSKSAKNAKFQFEAINDFVIHSKNYRVLPIKISILDKNKPTIDKSLPPYSVTFSSEFLGDGLIISTPLGSSAYAYSAGGEKMPLNDQKIQIVPICAYKRSIKTFVIRDDQKIRIETNKSCALIADGIFIKHLKDSILEIKKGKKLEFLEGVGRND